MLIYIVRHDNFLSHTSLIQRRAYRSVREKLQTRVTIRWNTISGQTRPNLGNVQKLDILVTTAYCALIKKS